jgi:hypothetical protein
LLAIAIAFGMFGGGVGASPTAHESVAEHDALTAFRTARSAKAERSGKGLHTGLRKGRVASSRIAATLDDTDGDDLEVTSIAPHGARPVAVVRPLVTQRNGVVSANAHSLRRHLLLGVLQN